MQTKIISAIVFLAALCGMLCAQDKNETKPLAVIEVLVLDEKGNPVPDAIVGIDTWFGDERGNGKTDKNGLANVLFSAEGWSAFRIFAFSPDGSGVQSQKFLIGEQKVTLRLRPPVKITGRIIDEESEKPITNVAVVLRILFKSYEIPPWSRNFIVMTDEQGCFRFDMFPDEWLSSGVLKSISEENPEMRRWIGMLCFDSVDGLHTFPVGTGESLDLGVVKMNAHEWDITARDRLEEANRMGGSLVQKFKEMFKRAKKNGRNVLFVPHENSATILGGGYHEHPLSAIRDSFEPFEFVTLHTPTGIGRDSRTFNQLKKMTGQEVQADVYMIAFSADGSFLGLCHPEDIWDQEQANTAVDQLRQFLEKHAPQVR